MNISISIICTVCNCANTSHYITTKALMHKPNNESYNFNKCEDCDSVFLTNKVEESELHNYYTHNYLPYRGSSAWGKFGKFVEISQKNLDKRRLKLLQKVVKGYSELRVLDVGCGNPSFLSLVKQKLNAKCTGIDFSDNGWKDDNYPSLELIKTSINDFVPVEKFDVITLWHYLEHDYRPQQTIEKLYNCLNTGGKLIIEIPDYDSLSAKLQKQNWQGWHSPRHITLFSKKGLQKLFSDEKWKITKHYKYGTLDAFTLWWLGKMEQKQINWSQSMEKEFWPLVYLKIVTAPFFALEKFLRMGVQIVIVEKR